jgi:hypothetical protein
MSMRDLGRLILSWRRFPPMPIAIDLLRRTYLAMHGVDTSDETAPGAKPARAARASREDCAGMFAMMKGMAANG